MVTVSDKKVTDRKATFTIRNNSTVPIRFKKGTGSEKYYYSPDFVLRPFESKSLTVSPLLVDNRPGVIEENVVEVNFIIENFMVAPDTPLTVKWIL